MEEPQKEPNTEQKSKDALAKNKRKAKKILLLILGIFLLILLVVIGIVAWIAAALFDPKPMPTVNKLPDMEQYQSCLMKFQQEVAKTQEDPNALAKDQTIELSKKEVNAVLDSLTTSARAYLAIKLPDTTICDVRFDNGILYADVSQKAMFSTPFGHFVNMQLAIIPKVANQHLYLDVKSLKAGSMELSGDWVQKYIDKDLRDFEKTEDGEMVVRTLKGLRLESDKVYITYSPLQIQLLLTTQLLKLFSDDEDSNSSNSAELLKLLQLLQ